MPMALARGSSSYSFNYKNNEWQKPLVIFMAEREGFEPSCACAQTDFESAPLWPLRYLSITMMQQRASYLWSPIRCGSMSLLIESTSHSQLEGRGACSPDVELANPRQRRDISYRCILYIFDFVLEGCPVMPCCGTQNLSLAFARQILTAATPYASLNHPPGALGNVPTSMP